MLLFLSTGAALLEALQNLDGQRRLEEPDPHQVWYGILLWKHQVLTLYQRGVEQTRLFTIVYDILLPPANLFIVHLALPYVIIKGLFPLRILLPWIMRLDEWALLYYLRSPLHRSMDAAVGTSAEDDYSTAQWLDYEDDEYTSRLMEQWIYNQAFVIAVGLRIGGMIALAIWEWYQQTSQRAFQSRWSTTRLLNADSDEEKEEDQEEEEDEEEDSEDEDDEEEAKDADEDDDSDLEEQQEATDLIQSKSADKTDFAASDSSAQELNELEPLRDKADDEKHLPSSVEVS